MTGVPLMFLLCSALCSHLTHCFPEDRLSSGVTLPYKVNTVKTLFKVFTDAVT